MYMELSIVLFYCSVLILFLTEILGRILTNTGVVYYRCETFTLESTIANVCACVNVYSSSSGN